MPGPGALPRSSDPQTAQRLDPDVLRKLATSTALGLMTASGATVLVVSAIQCAMTGHTAVPTEGIALSALVAVLTPLAIATIWRRD